jgi:hypothetical protein
MKNGPFSPPGRLFSGHKNGDRAAWSRPFTPTISVLEEKTGF